AIGRTEAAESRTAHAVGKANSEISCSQATLPIRRPVETRSAIFESSGQPDCGESCLPNLVLRSSDPQEPQPESYPLDSLAYIDLVLFHTVKGRKRHSLATSVGTATAPSSWECHVYQLEAEQAGLDFIREIDSRSEARQAAETRSQFSRARPEQQQQQEADKSGLNKWASQPLLLKSSATPLQAANPTAGKSASPRASSDSPRALASSTEDDADADEDAGPIRRTASGTIFDKYKELQKSAATAADAEAPPQPPRLPREAPAMQRAAASALAPNFLDGNIKGAQFQPPASRTRSSAALGGSLGGWQRGRQSAAAGGRLLLRSDRFSRHPGIEPPFGAAPAWSCRRRRRTARVADRPSRWPAWWCRHPGCCPVRPGSSSCRSRSAGPTAARYPARSSTGFTTAREAAVGSSSQRSSSSAPNRRRVGQAAKRRGGSAHTGAQDFTAALGYLP
uniref:LsmAD domain-containing protein n=1 Tax=Macrostomum lignano TaxID=282301 RepID=A0A1I8FP30_9PLAT